MNTPQPLFLSKRIFGLFFFFFLVGDKDFNDKWLFTCLMIFSCHSKVLIISPTFFYYGGCSDDDDKSMSMYNRKANLSL